MIHSFAILCKLNRILFSDRQWFEREAGRPDHTDGRCPACHAHACLSPFASYTRYLAEWKGGAPVCHEVTVKRFRCSSCGHTHALLPSGLVPYSSYSLRFILHVLWLYFLRRHTVEQLCEAAGIPVSTLYRWKARFEQHKALWLGVLRDHEIRPVSFMESLSGEGLKEFYQFFRAAFLQPLRRGDPNPPVPDRREADSFP